MPRPNKANGILAPLRDKFGKVPDHIIAEEAGLSLSTVGKYRRSNGLPAYQGYKFKKGELPPGHKAAGKTAKKKAKAPKKTAKKAATPKKAAAKSAPKKKTATKKAATKKAASDKKFRRSKLDPYSHLIGKLPDREVADMAGTTPDGVRMYRLRHGIPAASRSQRGQPRKVEAPKATKKAAPKKAAKKTAPKKAAKKTAAAPRAAVSTSHAYEVTVRSGADDAIYVVVAGDIVAAAQQASGAGRGNVVGVRHLAEALVAS